MRQDDYEIAEKLRVKLSKVVSLVDFRVFGSRAREKETNILIWISSLKLRLLMKD